MAKWFKEFPINLKNGTDRIRSASESGSQPRASKSGLVASIGTRTTGSKPGHRKDPCADGAGAGVGSLLSGRNRKNSAAELSRTGGSSPKDGNVWDSLLSGMSRKHHKAEPVFEEQHRPPKISPSASAYINRLIRLDKQDKGPNVTGGAGGCQPAADAEKPAPCKAEPVIILEDYADPFDAQKTREQREAERVGENDGYMEPYDAQQMITEIRRRGSKDLLKVCVLVEGSAGMAEEGQSAPLQIYDVPYEGSGDGDRTVATRPELDPRPTTEYELPWEWKKEHIVRTLSAQFDSPEPRPAKDETPHPTLTRQPQHPPTQPLSQHQHLRQKSWTQKILRSSPPTLSPSSAPGSGPDTEACCVDPSLPLERQSWYHGCVTRQEAECRLQSCKEASFLVRNSESDNSKYSIALKTSQGCVHIIVAQTKENGYTLDQSSCVFPSIPEVVHHYCAQRLPFNGAEHMTLLHPVPRIH
ncbi:SH2 domain-containing adapter protein E-like isoform X1 [Scophthalmus maximus]|uniref:SH2 domain-containing adapter protein E-like isoform X1 n=1 Tax=Scophthalmus maximus TaxID=52904 RepID=UPI001FA81C78|nr:SH2 domain-containing adapter protein E-like isoform X1 [Scophthalmus maximus]XP_047186133.1 SH2 domain-containing adapter protein E-like isoform X1 [Scophthalmus maximus]